MSCNNRVLAVCDFVLPLQCRRMDCGIKNYYIWQLLVVWVWAKPARVWVM